MKPKFTLCPSIHSERDTHGYFSTILGSFSKNVLNYINLT